MKSTISNPIVFILAVFSSSACSLSAQELADSPIAKVSAEVAVAGDTLASAPVATENETLNAPQLRDDRWRKTVHGWEWLETEHPAPNFLQLHPLLVAAFQLLVAVLVWLLAEHGKDRELTPENYEQRPVLPSPISKATR